MQEFDRLAPDYERQVDRSIRISGEGSEYFAEYKARYIAAAVPSDFRGKILDFGCDAGLLSWFLRQAVPDALVHGYDESVEMTAKARRRLHFGVFTTERSELHVDYDLIVAANVLHDVDPDRRMDVVSEMRERLGRGGRLAIFEHNPFNPLTRWAVSRCPFDAGVQLLSAAETRRHLTRAGLESVRVEHIVFFLRPMRWCRWLEPRLWWCPLRAQYVALATRGG
jgi:SAM-dependent methyltransferase